MDESTHDNRGYSENGLGWVSFCEDFAETVAVDFAQTWHNYLVEHPELSVLCLSDISNRFVDKFVDRFESEAKRICSGSRVVNGYSAMNDYKIEDVTTNGNSAESVGTMDSSTITTASDFPLFTDPISGSDSDYCDHDSVRLAKRHGGILRRLSWSSMKRNFIFNRHDNHLASSPSTQTEQFSSITSGQPLKVKKARQKRDRIRALTPSRTKTFVDVLKEGSVTFVGGVDLDGNKWEKGRLCLVRTAAGFMLEFYVPPKVRRFSEVFLSGVVAVSVACRCKYSIYSLTFIYICLVNIFIVGLLNFGFLWLTLVSSDPWCVGMLIGVLMAC